MRLCFLITLSIVLVCNIGCHAPIALGIIGAAGSDGPVAYNQFHGGKAESFCIANYDDVITATLNAGEALSLEADEKKIEGDQAFFRFYDAKKERIDILIERRSNTVTSIKSDVGWFGSVAYGRLMVRQIFSEINQLNAFLED